MNEIPSRVDVAGRFLDYLNQKPWSGSESNGYSKRFTKQELFAKKICIHTIVQFVSGEHSFKPEPKQRKTKKEEENSGVSLEQGECKVKKAGKGNGKNRL